VGPEPRGQPLVGRVLIGARHGLRLQRVREVQRSPVLRPSVDQQEDAHRGVAGRLVAVHERLASRDTQPQRRRLVV
jgi:hypothetical protein